MSLPAIALDPSRGTVQVGPSDDLLPQNGTYAHLQPPTLTVSLTAQAGQPASVGSPAWWIRRLLARLDERAPLMSKWDAYYRGDQPLAFASSKFRDAFGGRFREFCSNFSALVVDGTRERIEVTGFRFPSKRATDRAWRVWQDNDMDGESQIAHTEALVKGASYALVTPMPSGPRITIEDALDAIVESDPLDRRTRRAGLKRYCDDEGFLIVYLYLPQYVYRFRSQEKWSRDAANVVLSPWREEPGEPWPMRNPLGSVPLVPLLNRPRLKPRDMGQSEIASVMSNQDAINKYRADALVAAEFTAFRQRWATGLDIPTDPKTGKPVEPFKAAVDRLWVVPPPDPEDPNPPEVKFGEFEATDLGPYQAMIENEVGAMSSISRLPYHYLLGQPSAVPPSGESLKSSEAGLIAKVTTSEIHLGEGWEEAMRLCLLSTGDDSARDRMAETLWRDPSTINEAVRADATSKLYAQGIIDRDEARSAVGYAPGVAPATAPTPPANPAVQDQQPNAPAPPGAPIPPGAPAPSNAPQGTPMMAAGSTPPMASA